MKSNTLFELFKTQIFPPFCDKTEMNAEDLTRILFEQFEVYNNHYKNSMILVKAQNYWQKVVIPHKIAVYELGIELNEKLQKIAPNFINSDDFKKRLIIHDLSKFSTFETYGYMNYDFGKDNNTIQISDFKMAWHHHKHHNSHHPEYWFEVHKSGIVEALPMPKIDVVEMVADWLGAGKSYGVSFENWAKQNLKTFHFHQTTKERLTFVFEAVSIDVNL